MTLMTIHNAKGLEFGAVFLIGMEEGIFPHARSIEEQGIEEERRLAYVGMTRAKERLTLTHAATRSLFGTRAHNLPSRFLDELPQGEIVRERLRPFSWARSSPAPEVAPRGDIPSLATGDSVRHAALGEGVVVAIEPGGIVAVRFAGDERGAAAHARLRPAREDRVTSAAVALEYRNPSEDELRATLGAANVAFANELRDEDFELPAEGAARRPCRRRLRRRSRGRAHSVDRVRDDDPRRRRSRRRASRTSASCRVIAAAESSPSSCAHQLDDLHERGEPLAIALGVRAGHLRPLRLRDRGPGGVHGGGARRLRVPRRSRADRHAPASYRRRRLAELFPPVFERARAAAQRHALAVGGAVGRPGRRPRALARRREPEVLRPHRDRRARPRRSPCTASRRSGSEGCRRASYVLVDAIATSTEATRELWRFLFGVDLIARVTPVELRSGHAALPHGQGRPHGFSSSSATGSGCGSSTSATRCGRRSYARRGLGRARGDG